MMKLEVYFGNTDIFLYFFHPHFLFYKSLLFSNSSNGPSNYNFWQLSLERARASNSSKVSFTMLSKLLLDFLNSSFLELLRFHFGMSYFDFFSLNLRVASREFVAVDGAVGSGKSSLLAAILGHMITEDGKVNVVVGISSLARW